MEQPIAPMMHSTVPQQMMDELIGHICPITFPQRIYILISNLLEAAGSTITFQLHAVCRKDNKCDLIKKL